MLHTFNIGLHVVAGTIALILGIIAVSVSKTTRTHKRFGIWFLYCLSVVVTTGFVGWLFFRSNSFLLMLTILSGYVGFAGYRNIRLKEQKSTRWDFFATLLAFSLGILYIIWLNKSNTSWTPSVVYPTLGALMLVTIYDTVKFLWLHAAIKKWWLYEHIYKMVSAFSAILSAFCGTVFNKFQPLSQIGPSTFCIILIVFFIVREARKKTITRKLRVTT